MRAWTKETRSGLVFTTWLLLNLVLIGGGLPHEQQKSSERHFDYNIYNVLVGEDEGNPLVRRGRRWRRQALPTEHVIVHSMDSNVSVSSKQLMVLSSESKIELRELHMNATIWSNMSLLLFDGPNQESVALKASNKTIVDLRLNSAHLQSAANGLELNATTERDTSGETKFNVALIGDASLSLTDNTMTNSVSIQAANGQAIGGFAQSWSNSSVIQAKLSIVSVMEDNHVNRQLSIAAVSPTYQIQLALDGAEVSLSYGSVRVNIASNYRTVVLRSGRRRIELMSVTSPFEVLVTDAELTINCFEEKATVKVMNSSSDVRVNIAQLSRLLSNLSESNSELRLRAGNTTSNTAAERIELASLELQLLMDDASATANHENSILIHSFQSQLSLLANHSQAKITSARHTIEIVGGEPRLLLQTGNVTIAVSLQAAQNESIALLMPALLEPSKGMDENFKNIGPFGQSMNETNLSPLQGIPIDQLPAMLGGITSSAKLSTQTPIVIAQTNFFSAHMNESNWLGTSTSAPTRQNTPFPQPDPSLLTGGIPATTRPTVVMNLDGTVSTQSTEIQPTTLATRSTDNFVIGQFGNASEETTQSAVTTTDSTLFPISATISWIDLASLGNETLINEAKRDFVRSRYLRHLPVGEVGAVSGNKTFPFSQELLGFQMQMDEDSNQSLSEEEWRMELERRLRSILNKTQTSVEPQQHQDGVRIERIDFNYENQTAMLHLLVDNRWEDDFPGIVKKLSELEGIAIDGRVQSKTVSDVRVKRRSSTINSIMDSFVIIPAGVVIICFSFGVVFWILASKTFVIQDLSKRMQRYKNGGRIECVRPRTSSTIPAISTDSEKRCDVLP